MCFKVVRMQNSVMFGTYASRRQQLVAEGVLVGEAVRFVCVRRRHLRTLCLHGLDERRLGVGPNDCVHALDDLDNDLKAVFVVAGRAVVTAHRPRELNEFYPEYIVDCQRK